MELQLDEGWVEAELAGDFPHLGLVYAQLEARPAKTPRDVKRAAARTSPTATPAAR